MDPALEGFGVELQAPATVASAVWPIEFFVPGTPTTKNKKKAWVIKNKQGHVLGARVAHPERDMEKARAFSAVAAEHAPMEPVSCPVRLELTFTMPIARSWPKKRSEAAERGLLRHTSKPDLSRLTTFVEDTMTGVFYVDDSQIVELAATKKFGRRPGTLVRLTPLRGEGSHGG